MTDAFRERLEKTLSATYTFERELGGGGMSRTYLALEQALNRRVVVKVLAPELLEGLSVERFKREVLMAAQLQHPHVVPVLAAGDAGGLPWFSMPYVDGESLRQRLARGPVTTSEAMGILRDVARALAYAHQHGIVHRDIKPDNVLLSGGSATVTDFGIAKAISASRETGNNTTLTQAGMAIGTPAYMSPEQAAADPDLDHRADLYAFGAMAYELLGGQQLFAGRTPARVLAAHLGEVPLDVRELQPSLPSDLADLVMQCLAKEPDNRPRDAGEIVRRLDAVFVGSGSTSSMGLLPTSPLRLGRALGIWTAIAWLMAAVVYVATMTVGLPNWAMYAAGVLVAVGLPAVLGTWWIQRTVLRAVTATPTLTPGGTMLAPSALATLAMRASPHVSWARTWRGGAVALGLLSLITTGFMVSRAYGIGPAASLIGSGAFSSRETVVVADFRPPESDSTLGTTVAEALRTDLAQSSNLSVLTRAAVRDILDRMQRPRESVVYFPVAREIATREGARAVIDGEIVRLGNSYVISARLVSSIDGNELATFRETAANDEALIPAIGALSRSIRERVGESLKGLRQTMPLERVTTPSLPALRKYVEATRLQSESGNEDRSLQLLEEAVQLDTSFAMAWRRVAVVLNNLGKDRERAITAISTAMRFRDRLSDDERAQTEGYYYTRGPEPSLTKAIAAYEELLRRDSANSTALNNLSVLYLPQRRYAEAEALLRRAVKSPVAFGSAFSNLAGLLYTNKKPQDADSIYSVFQQRLPNHASLPAAHAWALLAHGKLDSAATEARSVLRTPKTAGQAFNASLVLLDWSALRGRPVEGLSHLASFQQIRFGAGTPALTMATRADSSIVSAFYLADHALASAQLHRAFSPQALAAVAPSVRPWDAAMAGSAFAGDSLMAKTAAAGYLRDSRPLELYPEWKDARIQAWLAQSRSDYAGMITQLSTAISKRETPNSEEAFLMGMAHDRMGRADSAIVWFERAVSTPFDNDLGNGYVPPAKKRLAELFDAKGDIRAALKWYTAFLDDWSQPEPSQESVVKAARARANELRAKLSPG